jgi:hypothetical protein
MTYNPLVTPESSLEFVVWVGGDASRHPRAFMKGKPLRRRLYLDLCSLCRPFDDQRAVCIHMESDTLYLSSIASGKFGTDWSCLPRIKPK